MSSKSTALMTKSEQDRQRVMNRAEKMNADYAKGLSAFDKDHRARMEAAEQRRLAALKQKVPMAHRCPASGYCEECEEKERKLKAATKASKSAFKKKTLNRQLSRSADDVSMILTQKSSAKATSEVGENFQKQTMVHKTIKSAKFTMNAMNAALDGAAFATSAMMGWMGLSSSSDKKLGPGAPAIPLPGTAKEAITDSTPSSSTSSSPESCAEPIRYGDGYVRDTAAKYLQISAAQKPKTTMTMSMQHRTGASQSSSRVVTAKGTTKETVMESQREQKKVRMTMK